MYTKNEDSNWTNPSEKAIGWAEHNEGGANNQSRKISRTAIFRISCIYFF